MYFISKRSKLNIFLFNFLFLIAGILHHTGCVSFLYPYVYIGLVVSWILAIDKRFNHTRERRYIISIGFLIIIWLVEAKAKYDYMADFTWSGTYLWYMYYISMLSIPLLLFYTVVSMETEHFSKKWYLLMIPMVLIEIGIMTNNYHELAFHFTEGIGNPNVYTHGILYFIAYGWIAVFIFASFAVMVWKCKIAEKLKVAWIPTIYLAVGIVYFTVYGNVPFSRFWELAEFFGYMMIGFIECCIQIGLIPANVEYRLFFRESTINASIEDNEGVTVLTSGRTYESDEKRDISYNRSRIRGGFAVWEEDLTDIYALNDEIKNINDVLSGESEVLMAESELMEEKAKIQARSRIYDEIDRAMVNQVNAIHRLISEIEEDPSVYEENMAWICFIASYIKRRANLILLDHPGVDELKLSILESMEYLKRCNIICMNVFGEGQVYDLNRIIFAYDIFFAIVEDAGKGLVGMSVKFSDDSIRFSVEGDVKLCEIDNCEGYMEDDTVYYTVIMRGGAQHADTNS